ncbi:MAG: hypothetical protein ACYDGN_16480 [Acidimicrobiales bacterium]
MNLSGYPGVPRFESPQLDKENCWSQCMDVRVVPASHNTNWCLHADGPVVTLAGSYAGLVGETLR